MEQSPHTGVRGNVKNKVEPKKRVSVESLFSMLVGLPPLQRQIRLGQIDDERIRAEVASRLEHVEESHTASVTLGAVTASMPDAGQCPQERQAGQQVGGKYRLLERLGEGGMGVVYKAFDEILQRNVALKFLASVQFSGQLLSEARAASALNHPNIVTIYDFGSDSGTDFIVMELIDGDTLRACIARGPLRTDMLTHLAIQAASVLDVTHRAKIVHGDIKPQNILFTGTGQVKLADFGIARRLRTANDTTATQPWKVAGTLMYMSPEQARGMPLDGRSDIYSLGVVLYEAACGRHPFRQSGSPTSLAGIRRRAAEIRELRPDLSEELAEILEKAMAEDPGDRFQTAGDMADALRRMEHGAPRTESPISHLPVLVNRFIGRQREVEEVQAFLLRDDVRLLNLTGTGGIGKTRLALEVCHQIARWFDSTWFVSLERIREPDAIAPEILRGLGLREADARLPLARLIEYFEQRNVLLVLDNFEQVAEGARVVSDLLDSCQRLKIMVTSRALLRLRLEQEYVVLPLPVSGANAGENLLQVAGIALFLDRSHAKDPSLETLQEIARICERVDGIPLAIELAAARTRVLAPKSILERLNNRFQLLKGGTRDVPQRHQALRNTMDWSYDLLEANERLMLQRLSVFDGGATMEAVESICCDEDDAVDLITSLADKSLLRQPHDLNVRSRIQMLETIREYAREKLEESGRIDEVQARHAAYYLRLAESIEHQSRDGSQADYYDSLETEQGNCRTALNYFLTEQPSVAIQIATALWPFWQARGYWSEGRHYLKRSLTVATEKTPAALRAKALYASGVLADEQGDYTAARGAFEEYLNLKRVDSQSVGDLGTMAAAMNNLGVIALRQSDYEASLSFYGEALAILQKLDSRRAVAQCLNNLGHVALRRGDYAIARCHYQNSLAICREIRSASDVAWTLSNLGDVSREESLLDEARSLYAQSFGLFREADNKPGMASCMADLGNVAVLNGDAKTAAQFYQESLVLFGDLGDRRGILTVLEGLVGLAGLRGRHQDALALVGAEETLRRSLGARQAERQQARHDIWIAAARAAVGSEVDRMLAEGARMTLEKAIEHALAVAALCYSDS
jgi:non-specific serine/threonine protein kinase